MVLKLLLFGLFIAVCFGCILLLGNDDPDSSLAKNRFSRQSKDDAMRADIRRLQARVDVLESLVRKPGQPNGHSPSA